MNFRPGLADEELKRLAHESGKSMAVVLRELVTGAPIIKEDATMVSAIHQCDVIGKKIKVSIEGDCREIYSLAMDAFQLAEKMRSLVGDDVIVKSRKVSAKLRKAGKRELKFRTMGCETKLKALATSSGISVQATLRALVLGIKLPSEVAFKCFAKISQLGGFLKLAALIKKDRNLPGDWRKVFDIGIRIRLMAVEILSREFTSKFEIDELEEGEDL